MQPRALRKDKSSAFRPGPTLTTTSRGGVKVIVALAIRLERTWSKNSWRRKAWA